MTPVRRHLSTMRRLISYISICLAKHFIGRYTKGETKCQDAIPGNQKTVKTLAACAPPPVEGRHPDDGRRLSEDPGWWALCSPSYHRQAALTLLYTRTPRQLSFWKLPAGRVASTTGGAEYQPGKLGMTQFLGNSFLRCASSIYDRWGKYAKIKLLWIQSFSN